MRIRKKTWAPRELSENEKLITDYSSYKGKWSDYFKNQNPCHCEIGCGKGRFIVETTLRNPDINHIAIEREPQVLAMALKLSRTLEADKNIAFINTDADMFSEIFGENEIERIYLNFSDPWPNRKKWAKRRLTYRRYLNLYKEALTKNGEIFFKTDNLQLFEFSLEEFKECGWELQNVTYDLHNSGYVGNIMTEYEEKFSEKGQPIYRLEAKLNPAVL